MIIKTRHRPIEILVEHEHSLKPKPKFKTKNADWEKWKQFLQTSLEDYSTNFTLGISEKVINPLNTGGTSNVCFLTKFCRQATVCGVIIYTKFQNK